MPKTSSVFICQQCGYQSSAFLGKCPECGTWNSLVEQVEESQKSHLRQGFGGQAKLKKAEIINLQDIKKHDYDRVSTKIGEFDRVLGGGIVPGSLILIAGDPGIGKSTLLTQLALNVSENSERLSEPVSQNIRKSERSDSLINRVIPSHSESFRSVLYISGEESAQQIKLRVDRIAKGANLSVLNETNVDLICDTISLAGSDLAIVDSIQTVETQDLESPPGSVSQVRESAHRLQHIAKHTHTPIILVGHITKEGTVAGPKTLEHLVDVVLSLEGDTQSHFRILRGNKNRFGSTDEVGIFDMTESGLVEIENPSKLFLQGNTNTPGSAITVFITGLRPLLLEIQGLVTKTILPIPRRIGTGVDNNRLQLLIAVLSKRLGLPLFDMDIYVNVAGGMKVNDPSADLGICMAVISSFRDAVIKPKTLFLGEVGLLGEVRPVKFMDKRIKEARKLGYTNIISPERVRTLQEAVKLGFAF